MGPYQLKALRSPLLILCAMQILANAAPAAQTEVRNLTGLPAYPNLSTGLMDNVFRTDTLGHWCTRFWAGTGDSLNAVAAWYRKNLVGASETDLAADILYKRYAGLSGVKFSIGVNYIAIYRTSAQGLTAIDLSRCNASQ